MKKEVNGILTEVPIMLKSIHINRRRCRMRNAEIWYVDGVTTSDISAPCAGMVAIMYLGKPKNNFVCGGISDVYDIAISNMRMWEVLIREFQSNLDVREADCYFTWRSGTVTSSWYDPKFFDCSVGDD